MKSFLLRLRANYIQRGLFYFKIVSIFILTISMLVSSFPSPRGMGSSMLFSALAILSVHIKRNHLVRYGLGLLSLLSFVILYPHIEFNRFIFITHFMILFYAFLVPGILSPIITAAVLFFRLEAYSGFVSPDSLIVNYIGLFLNTVFYTLIVFLFKALTKQKNELKTSLSTIQHMSYYDMLSELPNRKMFNTILNKSISLAKRTNTKLAIIAIDLDRFKNINDTFGHNYGDLLIQKVSARFKECLDHCGIIARQGGDEFLVLINYLDDKEEVIENMDKLFSLFAKPFQLGNQNLNITMSAGISVFPENGVTCEDLVKKADLALSKAKDRGRDAFYFYKEEMNEVKTKRVIFEQCLRESWERKDFILFYQPQVDLKTNKVIGAEALIRWQHEELGWVSPAEFIPIAEETGLIVPIGFWVLQEACAQMKKWQQEGFVIEKMAVNISNIQFNREDFISQIKKVLAENELPPEMLELELTETIALHDFEAVNRKLSELKELGVNVALDDFGTGYSSLNYLQKFHVHTLKIDKSFVQKIGEQPESEEIVEVILTLAEKMKFNVVAEGVENEKQLMFLLSKCCAVGQGFLFSKPVPASDLEKFFHFDINGIIDLPTGHLVV